MVACCRGKQHACWDSANRAQYDTAYAELAFGDAGDLVACDGGVAVACRNLALMLFDAEPQTPELVKRRAALAARSLALWRTECKKADMDACATVGELTEDAEAIVLLTRACDGGRAHACRIAATRHRNGNLSGKGVKADAKRAIELLEDSCSPKHKEGCSPLARALTSAGGNEPRVGRAYEQGCNHGDSQRCWKHARHLLRVDQPPDYDRVRTVLRRACELESTGACAQLGRMYETGDNVAKDRAAAAGLYDRACRLERADGCKAQLALGMTNKNDVALACYRAAHLYETGRATYGEGSEQAGSRPLRQWLQVAKQEGLRSGEAAAQGGELARQLTCARF